MAFTTVDKVRVFLNKTSLDVTETATVNLLIPMIDGVIKNYCGWNIEAKDYTNKKFSGNGTDTLDLRVFPINSLTALTIDSVNKLSVVSINSEDGELYFANSSGTFTEGTLNITATFNAGFTTTPDDLNFVAAWMVAENYKRITEEAIGIESQRFNDIEVKFSSTDIPVLVKHTLDKYRYIGIY